MSLLEKKEIEKNKCEVTVAVDAVTFETEVSAAFKKNSKSITMPGFRRGKAPRKMVEKMYGEGVFYEDAINALYPQALEDAVKEAKIEIVARPEIEVKEVSKDGFTFVATCITKPEVTIDNYKGIEVEKTVKTATEEDAMTKINALRDRNSRQVEVTDRKSLNGDTVVFDFEGFVEGKTFEGSKAEKFSLTVGSGQFIPGFEPQLIDKEIGEEFEVNVSFPEEYHAEELKGKPAIFKCKLHEIKAKELPELDDEFAKDVSEFDSLADLKADFIAKTQEQFDKEAETDVENKLIDVIIANMKGDIPPEMIETRIDEMVRDFEYRLQSQGLNIETYLQYTGMQMESFRQTFADQSDKQVKVRLALEQVVKMENIVVDEATIEAEYVKLAEKYKMEVEKVKEIIPSDDFIQDLSVNKAVDLVKETAKVTTK